MQVQTLDQCQVIIHKPVYIAPKFDPGGCEPPALLPGTPPTYTKATPGTWTPGRAAYFTPGFWTAEVKPQWVPGTPAVYNPGTKGAMRVRALSSRAGLTLKLRQGPSCRGSARRRRTPRARWCLHGLRRRTACKKPASTPPACANGPTLLCHVSRCFRAPFPAVCEHCLLAHGCGTCSGRALRRQTRRMREARMRVALLSRLSLRAHA